MEKTKALYVKVDGSYSSRTQRAFGGRAIYYNKHLIEATPLCLSASNSMETEYKAFSISLSYLLQNLNRLLSKAVTPVSSEELDIIRIYTDSQMLIKHLNKKSNNNTKLLRDVCSRIRSQIYLLETRYELKVEAYWVPRKCNLLADTLCKYAQCFGNTLNWIPNPPTTLIENRV